MKANTLRTEELLRIVGVERERYQPDELSGAEGELIARVGGTSAHVRRADRAEGLARCALGVVLGLLGPLALAAGFGWAPALVGPGDMEPAAGVALFIVASAIGAGLVLSGVALVLQWNPGGAPGWVIRKITRSNAAINRDAPWPEELVKVIGSASGSHSEAEVSAAMEDIRDRHSKRLRATKRTLRVSAGIGAYAGLCGTVTVTLLLLKWLRGAPGPYINYPPLPDSAPQLVRGAWDAVARTVALGCGLALPFLLVGCGALLFRREPGRRILVCVFGAWMVLAAVLGLGELTALPSAGAARLTFVGLIASALIGLAFYWLLLKSVRSPAVRELCRRDFKDAGNGSDGALTTQA